MKNFILICMVLLTLPAKSQTSVYFPFPDSSIVWRQEGYVQGNNCCCSGMLCLKEDNFQYFLNGDSIMGSFTYKKIYSTGNSIDHIVGQYTCPPWCTGNGQYSYYTNMYAGALRQDTAQRKVYFMPPGFTQDTLLYDFNLNAGDTLPLSWINFSDNYVTAIDSILIGSLYHKRFHLSGSFFPGEIAIIEGIGSTLGLLSPLLSNINVSNFYSMLNCVTINNVNVYPDTTTICTLISQVNNVEAGFSFSITPRLFNENLNISLNAPSMSEIVLYDITSRKIIQQKFINYISLNTTQLIRGIYFYEVRYKNEVIKKGKVVKK